MYGQNIIPALNVMRVFHKLLIHTINTCNLRKDTQIVFRTELTVRIRIAVWPESQILHLQKFTKQLSNVPLTG